MIGFSISWNCLCGELRCFQLATLWPDPPMPPSSASSVVSLYFAFRMDPPTPEIFLTIECVWKYDYNKKESKWEKSYYFIKLNNIPSISHHPPNVHLRQWPSFTWSAPSGTVWKRAGKSTSLYFQVEIHSSSRSTVQLLLVVVENTLGFQIDRLWGIFSWLKWHRNSKLCPI